MTEEPYNALTCLARIAAHHGTCAETRNFLPLCRGFERPANLFSLIHLARLLGLRAIPLEGPFSSLPDCNFPLIVPLRGAERRFAVVHAVDDRQVHIETERGRVALTQADFRAQWENEAGEGDVLDLAPGEDFPELARRLRDARNPLKRLKWDLGLYPPWGRKIGFITALLVIPAITLALAPQGQSALILALTACLLCALWSLLFAERCASCHGAARLAGQLPLAQLGVLFYLLLIVLASGQSTQLHSALALAVGIHGALLWNLWRAKVACAACIAIAGAVLAAALALTWTQSYPPFDLALAAVAAPLTSGALAWSRSLWERTALHQAFRLIHSEAPTSAIPSGRARGIVYKRENCAWCLLYESVVRPALEQEFGEALTLEERLVTRERIDVPLMILYGIEKVLVIDLRSEAAHQNARAGLLRALGLATTAENQICVVGSKPYEKI